MPIKNKTGKMALPRKGVDGKHVLTGNQSALSFLPGSEGEVGSRAPRTQADRPGDAWVEVRCLQSRMQTKTQWRFWERPVQSHFLQISKKR